jgi:hypothetical protein
LFTLALTGKDKKDASTTTKKKKKNKAPAYYTMDEVVTEVMSSLNAASTPPKRLNKAKMRAAEAAEKIPLQNLSAKHATSTTKTTTTKAATPTMSSLDIPPSVSKQKTLPVKWQKLRASFKFVRSVGFFYYLYCLLCQLINLFYALARDLLPFHIYEQITKRLSFKDCLVVFLTTSGLSIQ